MLQNIFAISLSMSAVILLLLIISPFLNKYYSARWCYFVPKILLPSTDYSNNELVIVLKHELTHFKRGDIWYKLLLIIANSIHWFNPFVYLMAKAANRDLEYSCDDVVVKNSDINFRKEYSLTILKTMQNGETTTL